MTDRRFHITGASGAGVTTLGRAIAGKFAIPHHDTDDYFWLPTDPPYQDARPVENRLRLMNEMFVPRPAWVLSGSLSGWGDRLIPYFDLIIFVETETDIRLDRLRQRELDRYGRETDDTKAFLEWAASYDDGGPDMRSRARHEQWLKLCKKPVLRLKGSEPVEELLRQVEASMTT